MNKIYLAIILLSLACLTANAQNVGIGNNNPQSKLDVSGSLGTAIQSVTSNTILDATYSTVLASPGITLTLPTAASASHRIYNIIYNGASGTPVTISSGSPNIVTNGASGTSTTTITSGSIFLQSDGTNWYAAPQSSASGGTGYIQNQTSADQSAGFRINGNGLLNGGKLGIGTISPDASSALEVVSNNKGVLYPRMTTTQRDAIVSPANSLIIFNTTTNCLEFYVGSSWQPIACGCSSAPAAPSPITLVTTNACQGNTANFTCPSVLSATTYTWAVPAGSGASITNGAGTPNITVAYTSTATAGAQTITVTASNSCGTSTPVTLGYTVNAIPLITAPYIANTTICANGAANTGNTSFTVNATGSGLGFQWQVNTGSGGWSNIGTGGIYTVNSTATTSTLSLTGTSTAYNGYQYQCLVTATCTPGVTAGPVTLTVNGVPAITAGLNPQANCNGTAVPAVTPTASIAGTTYNWSISNTAVGFASSSASSVNNIAAYTVTNSGNVNNITATVTVTPVANGCTGTAGTYTITAYPIPAISPAISAQINCPGTAIAAVTPTPTVSGATTTYNWSINNTGVGFGSSSATGASNIPGYTTTNSGNVSNITATVTVTPIANGCTGTASTYTITVYPTPAIVAISNQINCPGTAIAAVTPTPTVTGTTTTYNWSNSNTNVGLGSGLNGQANISAYTMTNSGNVSNITATVTVTPIANGCTGTAGTYTITVYPKPAISPAISNQINCPGTAIAAVTPSPTTSGTTYNWSISNTGVGFGSSSANGVATIPAYTMTNSGNVSNITATVSVTPIANGCTGTASTYTITVYPTPAISPALSNQSNCPGVSVAAVTPTPTVSGATTTYNWSISSTAVGFASSSASGASVIPAYTSANTVTSNVTATVSVTPVANGCSGAQVTYGITVTPTAVALSSGTGTNIQTVNRGSAVSPNITYTLPTGATGASFNWSPSLPTGLSANTTTGTISGTVNATVTPGAYSYTITPTGLACTAGTATGSITVCAPLGSAGTVSNPSGYTFFNYNASGIVFNSTAITNASSYSWGLTGTNASNATITAQSGTSCTVTFGGTLGAAKTCNITVTASNSCGATVTSSLAVQFGGTNTYSYTGANQSWGGSTYGVTNATIIAAGGAGGLAYTYLIGNNSTVGYGAIVTTNLAMTAPPTLNIQVGQQGTTATSYYTSTSFAGGNGGYYNGTTYDAPGGNGGVYTVSSLPAYAAGGGGGGATDIRVGGTALANRVIVAGGGGGAGNDYMGYNCSTTWLGGNAGNTSGGVGNGSIGGGFSTDYGNYGGSSGGAAVNGVAETYGSNSTIVCGTSITSSTCANTPSIAGALGKGGNGGIMAASTSTTACAGTEYYGGGGGGAGYYGGSGGVGAGGGGGSSYAGSGTSSTTTSVTNTGNGSVTINW